MSPTIELIESITLSSDTATVTFSNIPQDYDDLIVMTSTRSNASNVDSSTFLSFNNSTSNMTRRLIYGDGSAAYSATTSTSIYANTAAANATSNTFTSAEVYIPDYTSSNYKSWASSSVHENNATFAITHAIAGLWSSSSAINSIGFSLGSGVFLSNSTFELYGIKDADDGAEGYFGPAVQGGDEVFTTGDGYKYHIFKNSGMLNVTNPGEIECLLIAGGAGGGALGGGGGGGGVIPMGYLKQVNYGDYVVVVGAGGSNAAAGTTNDGGSGSNSYIGDTVAYGGGGGGTYFNSGHALDGGSGGGAGNLSPALVGQGVDGQGNDGGYGWASSNPPGDSLHGGGGGGYSQQGGNATLNFGGNGGQGYTLPSPISTFLNQSVVSSGGGGGARYTCYGTSNGTPGTGGTGAGNGSTNGATAGSATTYGSAGGGSGQTAPSGSWGASGSGYKGIVIIRYKI